MSLLFVILLFSAGSGDGVKVSDADSAKAADVDGLMAVDGDGVKAEHSDGVKATDGDSSQKTQEQDSIKDDSRWQYEAVNSGRTAEPGFSGLSFTGVLGEPDAPFFCLTEDSESGIYYGYVPAEMKGPLYVHLHKDEQLVITEGEEASAGSEDSSGTGDLADSSGSMEGSDSSESMDDSGSQDSTEIRDSSESVNSKAAWAEGLSSGDELAALEEGKHYTFSILDGSGQLLEEEDVVFLHSENVPSMYVETQSGSIEAVDSDKKHETEEAASYRIYLTSGEPDSGGLCRIKGRGNSTWSLAKRPYNLNLENANVILGMDSCKKYALIANFWDSTQTRQYFAFLAAERLGLEYTPQTQFVNLYLNGTYQSLYLLTQRQKVNGGTVSIANLDKENRKANRQQLKRIALAERAAQEAEGAAEEDSASESASDGEGAQEAEGTAGEAEGAQELSTDGVLPESVVMEDDGKGHEALAYAWEQDPEDISGGYLLEFQNRYKNEDAWFSTDTLHISFKSPETPSVGEYEYISAYVREAEKALFADDWTNPETGLGCFDYFDMDSWAKMYLIQDFFVQSDDEYYSFFFYKKRDDALLYCGPVWDFDLCLGNMNCGDYYLTSARTLLLKDGRKRWLHRMEENPQFRELVAKIYLEELEPIARGIVDGEYEEMADRLEKVTELNYLRWHKNLDYRDRTGRVRTLIETRTAFLHDYYSDPSQFHRLLFRFAWGDFSYYVKDGEAMGFLPTAEYGEKQSSPQREANGFITGWRDVESGTLLSPDEPVYGDRTFEPVYE